ncbi:hypothetical protein ABID08_005893 [Rhizobium binae]|uniref:Uncharacterized protein n=1 Tax=Rhizobium binae TaxID=1138190 RepID=A0ABV2MPW9_9HYPH|nr:hypothetical protein [Rhizobium binae]MBX4949763.1 hypothetical protein [Rhizobium binae]MBX4994444.1 hypothetical protein [Rhizobium binae]QSY84910.1 hypothetical protein J2J99_23040 [Rhizobium binae]
MERPKDDSIRVERLSADQQRSSQRVVWLALTLIATALAIAFLLYVSILIYGVMQRM